MTGRCRRVLGLLDCVSARLLGAVWKVLPPLRPAQHMMLWGPQAKSGQDSATKAHARPTPANFEPNPIGGASISAEGGPPFTDSGQFGATSTKVGILCTSLRRHFDPRPANHEAFRSVWKVGLTRQKSRHLGGVRNPGPSRLGLANEGEACSVRLLHSRVAS